MRNNNQELRLWLIAVLIALTWSGINPKDQFTWFLETATAFLGTQGDDWDTQWDMFLALPGAITSQLLLGYLHDKHLVGMK